MLNGLLWAFHRLSNYHYILIQILPSGLGHSKTYPQTHVTAFEKPAPKTWALWAYRLLHLAPSLHRSRWKRAVERVTHTHDLCQRVLLTDSSQQFWNLTKALNKMTFLGLVLSSQKLETYCLKQLFHSSNNFWIWISTDWATTILF